MNDAPSTAGRASRIDPATGIREEITFIGTGAERLFSTLHAPAAEPIGGIVLCSSILAELLSGYQEEVWLCRRLAERGLTVRRFHYRGTGHSDGDAEDVTYERLVEDARLVANQLRSEVGGAPLGLIGTRVGGVVAASIAAEMPGAPLALIHPVLDLDRLFKDMTRARQISLMNEEGRSPDDGPPEDMYAVLERERSVDVLGYRLTEPMLSSLRPRKLALELGTSPRPVQLIQVAKRKQLMGEFQRFLEGLSGAGFETDAQLVVDEIAWWFHDTRRHLIPEIGDAVVPWIAGHLEGEGR